MIHESTRQKLKNAANKNRLGHYKIYDRKSISKNEIDHYVSIYKKLESFSDLFIENVVHKNEYNWRNSIIRRLDVQSCNLFFFSLESDIPNCKYCNVHLSIKEYSYNRSLKFSKYCSKCSKDGIFRKYKHSEKSIEKFKSTKRIWTQSTEGKLFYKRLGDYNSKHLKKYFKTQTGKDQITKSSAKQSKILKEKIKNGTFSPNITNSWTHWEAKVLLNGEIHKFRSSWEASFYVSNRNLKYEVIRIPYVDCSNKTRTYIGDFYDEEKNTLYEIKPRTVFKKENKKINQVIRFCIENKIKFIWINEDNILKHIDKNDFSEYNIVQYLKMLEGIYGKNKDKINKEIGRKTPRL